MSERFEFDPGLVFLPDEDTVPEAIHAGDRALHVEIGFGKDIHSLRRAAEHPEALFLGVEISRKKAASFCRKVARAGLRNVRACCADVRDLLCDRFPPASVDSFTILFPDPWPKRRHAKHRWIQPGTAAQLAGALRPGGMLVTATDHDGYARQIEAALSGAGLERVVRSDRIPDGDRTLFAERFERLGEGVTYLRFRRPAAQA